MNRLALVSPLLRLGRAAVATAFAAGALFVPAAGAQTGYSINSVSPNALPAGNPAVTLTVNVATGSSAFNVCFFTGYGGSGTPLVPTSSTSTGNGYIVTVNVPASSIQQIPASAYSDSNPPSFAASVYAQSTDAASCTQANPDGSAAVTLTFPTINGVSLTNVPAQNPNLSGRIPSNLNLSGTNFVPNAGGSSSTVTYVGGSATDSSVPTVFVKSTELRSNLPTNIPAGTGTLSVTECNQSAGNSYCSTSQQITLYPLATNSGTLTATPNPPMAGQATSFTADFGPATPAANYGAPGGLVTFSEGSTTLGSASLILDPTAQLTQIQSDGSQSNFNSTATSLVPFIADFNNDGVPDSMYLDSAAKTFHILLGVSPYAYDQPIVPANNQCSSIPAAAVGDFNNDGIPDIAYLCQLGNLTVAYTMLGLGDGSTFTNPVIAARGTPSAIATGDFNHDGNLDIVLLTTGTSDGGTPQVSFDVYLGDGTGHFTEQDNSGPFAAVPLQGAGEPNQFVGADINGDGATDLVLLASAGSSGPGVYVFQNTKDANGNFGSFAAPLQPINGNYTQVVVAPLNTAATVQSQCIDSCRLPTVIAVSPTRLLTALNTSTSSTISFFNTLQETTASASSVAAGDFNGDGFIDVAVIGPSGLQVLTGDGGGYFSATPYSSLTDPSAPTNGIVVGAQDENGDGFSDLMVLNQQVNTCGASPCPITYSELTYFTAGTSSATFSDQAGFASGAHTITATTPGTYTIAGGSASTSFTVAASLITPTVMLSANPISGAAYGTAAVLTAAVGGSTVPPTGTVTFSDGSTQLGIVMVSGNTSIVTATLNAGLLAAGTHSLTALYSGDSNYTSASGTLTYIVAQATPQITWLPNPSSIPYGTTLSSAQLDATASVPGTFAYTPGLGATLPVGAQQVTAVFTPTDSRDYQTVTTTTTITVTQGTPTVSWVPNPSSIAYGTPLGSGQLDATASVPGSFVYTPAAGTVLNGGTQTLTAVFTPTDSTDYKSVNATATISVTTSTPTITWVPNPSTIVYGTALGSGQLDATSTVPGTFAYTPASGAILTAGQQTLTAVFTPTNSSNYQPTTLTRTITVTQATPSVSWVPNPSSIPYGTTLSSAQLDATASVPGSFAYTPGLGATLPAGAQQVTAVFTPTDSRDYQTVTTTTTITVSQGTPTVSWVPNPSSIAYGTPLGSGQLDATASIPGSFAYIPAAGTVLNVGSQTLTAVFTPTNTTDYKSVNATATITVTTATPTITWVPNPSTIVYGTALGSGQLDAASTTPGTFAYTPAAGAILTAGQQTLTAVFTPSNSSNYQPTTLTRTITVTQATPALSWTPPAAITSGTALSSTQLDASAAGVSGAPLPGAFTYTPTAGTVLSSGSHQLSALFTPTDTVDYTTATISVPINVFNFTLVSVTPNTGSLGDPNKPVVLTGTGFLPNSVVLVNGAAVATTYVSSSSLQATIPASDFLLVQTLEVAVSDPAAAATSNALPISVTAPPVSVSISGPTTTQVGLEPQILFTLEAPYPVPITGAFTLTFAPANGSPDDPMIRFATPGTNTTDPTGRTFGFLIPADSTATPTVLLQSGSTAGVITINLVLFAGGANITPASVQPLVITEPDQVPGVISTSISAEGHTLTVVIRGYSNTRELTQANFHFDAAPGQTLNTHDLQIDETALFTQWYSSAISAQYGSTFTYTQTFNLNEDATVVGAVQVTLTNSVGVSALGSSE